MTEQPCDRRGEYEQRALDYDRVAGDIGVVGPALDRALKQRLTSEAAGLAVSIQAEDRLE